MERLQVGPVLEGKRLADGGGGSVDVLNPATGETVARQACCDPACVDRIVESSDRAFHSSAWQGMTPADRGCLLLKIADRLEAEAEKLLELERLAAVIR